MLNRASNVYGTGPEPTIECTSSPLITTASHGNQVTSNPCAYYIEYRVQYMSDLARRETVKPRYSYKKCVLMSDIISLDDGLRRKAKVLQAIKSLDRQPVVLSR